MAPESAAAHKNLAGFLFKQGDFAGARMALESVATLDPAAPEAQRDLAVVCWRLKDYDDAWAYVRQARAQGHPVPPEFIEQLRRDSGRNG